VKPKTLVKSQICFFVVVVSTKKVDERAKLLSDPSAAIHCNKLVRFPFARFLRSSLILSSKAVVYQSVVALGGVILDSQH
jgi:hypothetical protein